MQNKSLYRINSSSDETDDKTIITVTFEISKFTKEQIEYPQDFQNSFVNCMRVLNKHLLRRTEEIYYSCYGQPSKMTGWPQEHYFKLILDSLSIDELNGLRGALFKKSI